MPRVFYDFADLILLELTAITVAKLGYKLCWFWSFGSGDYENYSILGYENGLNAMTSRKIVTFRVHYDAPLDITSSTSLFLQPQLVLVFFSAIYSLTRSISILFQGERKHFIIIGDEIYLYRHIWIFTGKKNTSYEALCHFFQPHNIPSLFGPNVSSYETRIIIPCGICLVQ